ncbi:hypothetical protein Nepgr_024623 [Nepenthes gracilis]|uniref:Uncharacterized protein n=1 Tax=Nepenthes gracilis TaxID=150966 RepID=A0AAD3T4I5_NEPGR|nr:hypothetical protein Nepgr_024623 [Nepenthes gracilis]
MVVDMQARVGNKWATIATYLPGRTDNDVKNFWSTRQKRLARILQSSSSSQQHKPPLKSKGKLPLVHHQASASPLQVSMVGGGDCNQVKEEASSSYNNQQPQSSSLSYLQNNEIIMAAINPQPLVINDPSTQELLFTQLPQHPKLDHSFLLENQDLVTGFVGEPSGSGLDFFPHQNACGHLENVAPFCYGSPAFGFDTGGGSNQGGGGSGGGGVGQGDIGNLANPEILFDDFPAIVFDSLEPFPSSPEH